MFNVQRQRGSPQFKNKQCGKVVFGEWYLVFGSRVGQNENDLPGDTGRIRMTW